MKMKNLNRLALTVGGFYALVLIASGVHAHVVDIEPGHWEHIEVETWVGNWDQSCQQAGPPQDSGSFVPPPSFDGPPMPENFDRFDPNDNMEQ